MEELAFVLGKEHGLDELVQKLHPEFEKVEGEEVRIKHFFGFKFRFRTRRP